jgi:uncharacterized protein
MNTRRVLAYLPLVALLAVDPADAQQADTLRLPVEPEVELLTIVHRPPGDGPHPVVLFRNPYRTRGGSMGWLADRLVPHGYAVIEQDVRGTGGSDGNFVPFRFDVQDGVATLDWIAAQPWAGPLGLWGVSYLGWAAYALAETGHPAIEAMVVGSAWADMEPFLFPGGAFNLMAHLTWMLGFGGGGGMPPQASLDSIFQTLPLAPLMGRANGVIAMAERPYRWEAVTMPVLHFTGWNDYIYRDALRGYENVRRLQGKDASQRLIIGPWSHNQEFSTGTRVGDVDFGPEAAAGMDSIAAWTLRFFDQHLREDTAAEADPVRVFVMGENHWRGFDEWPPSGSEKSTWYLAPGAQLEARAPEGTGHTSFVYDPAHPMPTLGGVNSHFFPENLGPLDQASLAPREDLASFLGPTLTEAVVITGPIRAVLHLEADAPSTDVAVKLVTVAPDGTARLVEDGIRRLPSLQSGVTEVTVDLGQRALRLEPGTRLRVDVTGGNFPKYDRNPNTGEDPWTATELRPVTITLHHGGRHPSRLELVRLAP